MVKHSPVVDQNLDPEMLKKVVSIVQSALDLGVEIAIVVGGEIYTEGPVYLQKE